MKLVVLTAVTALATTAAIDAARACDCGTGDPTVAEGRATLATVVHGRVVAARTIAATHDHQLDLLVLRAWKGATAGATITVAVDGSSCGYFFVPGDEALIFAPAGHPLQQCAGDQTARVRTGADIAADAAALGPPTSAITAPATSPGPTPDVVVEGTVTQVRPGARASFQVRVTTAVRGAVRRQRLDVTAALGRCGVAAPPVGSTVEVRAVTVRGAHVVTRCLDTLGLTVRRRPARRARRP